VNDLEKISEIKKSLITELKNRSADVALYRDQIDDYIFITRQERKMQADIKKRGLSYTATSAAGKEYEKDNPSVKGALMYSKQRLAIITSLGLSTEKITGGKSPGDDESDL
jgi:hypothetical protein